MDFARLTLRSRALNSLLLLPLTLSTSVMLSSCNAFEMFDSPSNDAQYLSVARACFDQGDLECARENYQKLSNDQEDVKKSELALALIDEAGITMSTFLSAFASGGDGGAINGLAEALTEIDGGVGIDKRNLILEALQAADGIQDAKLRGFTRFLASLSLFAEVLGEIAAGYGNANLLEGNDLATNANNCKATGQGGCVTQADCEPNISGQFDTSVTPIDLLSVTELTGKPSIGLINSIVEQLNTALATELAVSGGFETGTGSIAESLEAVKDNPAFAGAVDRCLTFTLLDLGIGR